jgi:Uncharacterized conserved protein (DUF2267)
MSSWRLQRGCFARHRLGFSRRRSRRETITLPATLSHAVQKTQQWLKELRDNGNLADEAAAYSVVRAILHQLRDRLTPEEAADLAAQLLLIVRGVYFEGWRPGQKGAHRAGVSA